MQNLGYHFCQISQNVMPILKPIISSSSIKLYIFLIVFSQDIIIFKDSKHIILLILKMHIISKNIFLYKIYLFMHHSFEEPYL
jgi:hypothetical protein